MKEIKRYDHGSMKDFSGHSYYGMVQRPEGKFVLVADYDALKAENERLRHGMKGDYDLDAWLEWCTTKDSLAVVMPERDQPARPTGGDEREAFEAWQRKDGWKRPNDPGEWEAWQARAALAGDKP